MRRSIYEVDSSRWKPAMSGGISGEISYRPLRHHREFRRCVDLQKETWGENFVDVVPSALLNVAHRSGGIVAGAFDPRGHMLGFVFGLAGHEDGEPVQWSHMLAVTKGKRGLGIGRGLKFYQRKLALERGVRRIRWTFDPLQAANAHLNLNRLGVHITEYVPDMYGRDTRSPLHPGGATDRLVAEWRLEDDRVRRAERGGLPGVALDALRDAPLLAPPGTDDDLREAGGIRLAIPCDFLALSRRDPDSVRAWRLFTRRAFLQYLRRDYVVDGFFRTGEKDERERSEPVCFYYLRPLTGSSAESRGGRSSPRGAGS